jgi:3-dehydrosphinganine reductase
LQTVLLTGASQGMGKGVAKTLAQKGANVILVARDETKLENAKQYITAAAKDPTKQRFIWISADVTKAEENERIVREATAWNNGSPPDIVWQVAGSAHPALFLDTSLEINHKQMDINYWAACYLAHTTLKLWTGEQSSSDKSADTSTGKGEPPARHFIMTSSVAIYAGFAGYAPYSPAKAAMRSLADTLRSEINLYNGARFHGLATKTPSQPEIKIHLVVPGTILSPGLENENKTKHPVTHLLEDGDIQQTEDEVAAAAIKGLEKGDYMITTQFLANVMRVSALGGSPRSGMYGIRDTILSWAASIAWLFIGPDMEKKVWKYGKDNGVTPGPDAAGK